MDVVASLGLSYEFTKLKNGRELGGVRAVRSRDAEAEVEREHGGPGASDCAEAPAQGLSLTNPSARTPVIEK